MRGRRALAWAGTILACAWAIGLAGPGTPGHPAQAAVAGTAPPATFCGTGTWTQRAPLTPGPGAPAVAAQGGLIYSFYGDSADRYDPALDQWTALPSLPVSREQASAVSDGTYLYVLNGYDAGEHASLWRYDPATGTYTTLAAPPLATADQAAVYLDGKIYRLGGWTAAGPVASVDVYTIATDTWAPAGTVAPYPLAAEGLAVIAAGGYIYTAGGGTNDTLYAAAFRYDPATNTWDDAAVPDLPQQRYAGASAILAGHWILAGGAALDYQPEHDVIALDLGNPAAGWTDLAWEGTWRRNLGGAVVGDTLYTVGGYEWGAGSSTVVEAYQPDACPLSTGTAAPATATAAPVATSTPPPCGTPTWTQRAPRAVPGGGGASVTLGGALYVFGGLANGVPMADAARYDSGADRWTALRPLPVALVSASAATDGRYIYVVNGTDVRLQDHAALYRYDPATDTYTTLAPAPISTDSQALVYLAGRLYRIAGERAAGPGHWVAQNEVDIYDLGTGLWTPAAPFPVAAYGLSAVAFGGYLYAAVFTGTYRYDPATNTWDDAAVTNLPESRWWAGSAIVDGRWILAGSAGSPLSATVWSLALADPAGPWTALPALPLLRGGGDAGGIGDSFYLAGGIGADSHGQGTRDLQRLDLAPCPPPATVTATPMATATATPSATPTLPPTATPVPVSTATPPLPSATPPSATATPAATPPPLPSATMPPSAPPAATPPSATPSATVCAVQFGDVHPADYFAGPVAALACRGVVSGYADGTFRPYSPTTRAQLVKLVVLGFGRPLTTPAAGTYTFADVPPGHPFFAVVETAAADRLAGGYGCGGPGEPCDPQGHRYFRPGLDVTRGQVAKLVVTAAGWALQTSPTARFADAPPGSPFFAHVETAACAGALGGYSCGGPGEPCDGQGRPYFRPGNSATRGQIAKVVYNALLGPAGCALRAR